MEAEGYVFFPAVTQLEVLKKSTLAAKAVLTVRVLVFAYCTGFPFGRKNQMIRARVPQVRDRAFFLFPAERVVGTVFLGPLLLP